MDKKSPRDLLALLGMLDLADLCGASDIQELSFSLSYNPDPLAMTGRQTFKMEGGGESVNIEGDVTYAGSKEVLDESGKLVTEYEYTVKVVKATTEEVP